MRNMLKGMLFVAMLAPVVVYAAGKDELWEMTTRTEMPGMPMNMPGMGDNSMVVTSCQSKEKASLPQQSDKNCSMSDVKVSGNTTKWKVRCTGDDPMEGRGEMTRTGNTMKGTIKMSSRHGNMTQTISGKLVGACNAATDSASARQSNVARLTDNMLYAQKAEECPDIVESLATSGGANGESIITEKDFRAGGACADYLPKLCKKTDEAASTAQGYQAHDGKDWVVAACKIDLKGKRPAACKDAKKTNKRDFIKQYCPAEQAEMCNEAIDDDEYATIVEMCPSEKIATVCRDIAQKEDYSAIKEMGAKCPAEIIASACQRAEDKGKYDDIVYLENLCPAKIKASVCKKTEEKGQYEYVVKLKNSCSAGTLSSACKSAGEKGEYGYVVELKRSCPQGVVLAACNTALEKRKYYSEIIPICPVEAIASACKDLASQEDYESIIKLERCPAGTIKPICKNAASKEDAYAFMVAAKYCPAEAKTTAKTNCERWGRDYTSDEVCKLCAPHVKCVDDEAGGESNDGGMFGSLFGKKAETQPASGGKKKEEPSTEKPASSDNPVGNVLDGAKKLKGLIGF